ncbi:alpha/beta fold hydrolase [Neobacillus drentensis]|uniref:alpha/beta fold hydrolase n=1 Tax=Neobacillus drentensis TaxID=220684 RepID=UPI000824E658|nr:alpha/beta hydrolase [Neobacillus drentensis]MDR7235486.1 2-hydroxymuconate-semialdehyde hydrolase [Neobacillus drentensis]
MSYQTEILDTGRFQTFYCEAGQENEEVIVFLHGSGPGADSVSNWQHLLPELAKDYHVIAPDMYGFGNTKHPEVYPKSFWEWTQCRVDQLFELLDKKNIDQFSLVGNSMGGYVSLNVVMQLPERVKKVLLMGSGGGETPPTPEILRMVGFYKNPTFENLRNLTTWFVHDPSSIQDSLEDILKIRYETIQREDIRNSYVHNMFPMPGEILIPPNALRQMAQPFLLLHGLNDRFVPKESSIRMMEHLPNAELRLFTQCGHWMQVEKREDFIKAAREFF